jgi:hypothetical protein
LNSIVQHQTQGRKFQPPGISFSTDGNKPPSDEVTDKKWKETGCETKYDNDKPNDGRIGIRYFTNAAANSCNLFVRLRSIEFFHFIPLIIL